MNRPVLCLDFDGCLLPNNHTFVGIFHDSTELLKMNMLRIEAIIKRYNPHIFITSSWYDILDFDEETLSIDRKLENEDDPVLVFEELEIIKRVVNGHVCGISCCNRYIDIVTLLKDDRVVVALDDADLNKNIVMRLTKEDEFLFEHYCFVEIDGFITNGKIDDICMFLDNYTKKEGC